MSIPCIWMPMICASASSPRATNESRPHSMVLTVSAVARVPPLQRDCGNREIMCDRSGDDKAVPDRPAEAQPPPEVESYTDRVERAAEKEQQQSSARRDGRTDQDHHGPGAQPVDGGRPGRPSDRKAELDED